LQVLAAGVNNTEINTRLGWYFSAVTTPTSQPGSPLLDLAFSILEQLARALDRRQTRNGHSVVSKGFQAVLEVQVPT
jgi:hypothetical protein